MTGPSEHELTSDDLALVIATTADTAALTPIPGDDPAEWLAALHDDGGELGGELATVHVLPPTDLRLAPYPEQVSAAVHGDGAVFTLPPLPRQRIEQLSWALRAIEDALTRPWPADPALASAHQATVARRAAAILWHDGNGTPFRCTQCQGVWIGLDGEPDWRIAGREDTTCPPCTLAAPRHAAPELPAAKPATARARRPRKPPAAKGGAA